MRNAILGLVIVLVIASAAYAAKAVTGSQSRENDDTAVMPMDHEGMMAMGGECKMDMGTDADADDDDSADEVDEDTLGVYACPMFCDNFVTTDPEAKCPSCNMAVVPVTELYVCPDHPTEFSMDPKSVCSETDTPFVEVEQLYNCPMHPDEISADPDGKCSQCGMKLEPIDKGSNDGSSGESEGGHECSHSGSGESHGSGGCCAGH